VREPDILKDWPADPYPSEGMYSESRFDDDFNTIFGADCSESNPGEDDD
jgi:hypothetical protein